MNKNSTQMLAGKAFEYAILKEFQEKLERNTNVEVVQNDQKYPQKPYIKIHKYF